MVRFAVQGASSRLLLLRSKDGQVESRKKPRNGFVGDYSVDTQKPDDAILSRIRDKFPAVDPIEFHEVVSKQIMESLGLEGFPQVAERFMEFEIGADDGALTDKYAQREAATLALQNTKRIKELLPIKPKELDSNPINHPVAPGGLTRLHVLCFSKGDENFILQQVKELITTHGANHHIKDNSGHKPVDKARARRYTRIVAFLSSI